MAELRPYPFRALVTRMLGELEARGSIFDLPRDKFFLGDPQKDLAVRFHGRAASTPLGPAAGPQSQMAQNIVLSWLGGSRIMELKTVQIDDRFEIPRPCIDMQTVGYNVEWSQELRIPQSLEEYVKGSMLVDILKVTGELALAEGFGDTLYDMSVGYDLAGIRSDNVQSFIRGMKDATAIVNRLRPEIPDRWRHLRDLDFTTRLSDTLTLSTFHGCPPDEIESIIDFLLREAGLHCVIKLNPMLLGPQRARELLHDRLGYVDITIPDTAFTRDATWDQAVAFVDRLGETATALGLGLGVKFTNTLIVENHRDFFPEEEKEMYLSGPPLHVLAMDLVGRLRKTFGDRFPISFSAGVDRGNFADCVALGLVPITVCSDLLKPGGYARSRRYFDELTKRMAATGSTSVGDFVIRGLGLGGRALERAGTGFDASSRAACEDALRSGADLEPAAGTALYERWVSQAALLNTEHYVADLADDTRYHLSKNSRIPRKIGSDLVLFDCITCDKCIPVCPNAANFTLPISPTTIPIRKLRRAGDAWTEHVEGELALTEKHQIANFADFCNDCGNCDVFCPEDGGPYVMKPRFFGTLADWHLFSHLDGFALERQDGQLHLHARFEGRAHCLFETPAGTTFAGPAYRVLRSRGGHHEVDGSTTASEIDLTPLDIMRLILDALVAAPESHFVLAGL